MGKRFIKNPFREALLSPASLIDWSRCWWLWSAFSAIDVVHGLEISFKADSDYRSPTCQRSYDAMERTLWIKVRVTRQWPKFGRKYKMMIFFFFFFFQIILFNSRNYLFFDYPRKSEQCRTSNSPSIPSILVSPSNQSKKHTREEN